MKTIDADPNETATTDAQAPLVIQQLRGDGATSLIPLIPFNVFFPVLQAETAQQWFPRLLLSDYESSILSSLGLIPVPYAKALNGQEGVTTETLGGIDDPRPEGQGGYDPGVRKCWKVWHKVYPAGASREHERFHRGTGANRRMVPGHPSLRHGGDQAPGRTSTGAPLSTAMSEINNFPGHLVPRPELRPEQALRSRPSTTW